MSADTDPVIVTTKLDGKIIEIVFKPDWRPGKLMEEEKQLLRAYRNEILAEIEIEEKRIIAEERRAAKEVTARKPKQED
jgi:hypothetical protein